MEEGDGDTWYCFYAVMKLNWKPSEFAFLPRRERILMYAFIDEKLKQDKEQKKRIESKAKGGR